MLKLKLGLNLNLNSGSQLSRMLYQSYLVPVLSLAGCYLLMQVRWGDQTQYPMIVVASLSAVPQSCRTPLPNQYLDCMLLAVYTHTHTHKPERIWPSPDVQPFSLALISCPSFHCHCFNCSVHFSIWTRPAWHHILDLWNPTLCSCQSWHPQAFPCDQSFCPKTTPKADPDQNPPRPPGHTYWKCCHYQSVCDWYMEWTQKSELAFCAATRSSLLCSTSREGPFNDTSDKGYGQTFCPWHGLSTISPCHCTTAVWPFATMVEPNSTPHTRCLAPRLAFPNT